MSKNQHVTMRSTNPARRTPKDLFKKLDDIYGFEVDCCADDENKLCTEYYAEDNSFLNAIPWGDVCFMNPPYGRGKNSSGPFIAHAHELSLKFNKTFICLVAARTGTKWFQTCWEADYLIFIRGQLKFDGLKANAPFCSVLVCFDSVFYDGDLRKHQQLEEIGKVIIP